MTHPLNLHATLLSGTYFQVSLTVLTFFVLNFPSSASECSYQW